MSHALTKSTIAALAACTIASCSNNAERQQAEALFIMAETAAENGDYDRSIALLDSIDGFYAKQIEVRKKGSFLRAKSLEGQTLSNLTENEREAALLKLRSDSLQQFIVKVDNPLEPYYVARGMAGKSVVGKNGIEARLMPNGTLYLISSLKTPRVGHTSVTAICGDSEISTATIRPDGERNDRSMGYEVIHYMPAECIELATFIASNVGKPITLRFNGENGSTSLKLDDASQNSITTLVEAAGTLTAQRRNELNRQRLEKQLELSRNQAAKTFSNEPEQND